MAIVKVFITLLILCTAILSYGQENTLNSQYIFNKRKYNPGYISDGGAGVVGATFRNQWWGNPEAPKNGDLMIQIPVMEKLYLGGQISYGQSVFLKEFNGLVSATYVVPINTNQRINFGLAAGILQSGLDLEEGSYDVDDEVLRNLESNIYPDLRFGFTYTFHKLNLGFSLPKIFNTQSFSYDTSEIKLNNIDATIFDDLVVSLEYEFDNFHPDISILPHAVYRKSTSLYEEGFVEGGVMVEYKKLISIGGTYSTYQQFTGVIGVAVANNLSLKYAYEMPISDIKLSNVSTHEFKIAYRFGAKREKNSNNTSFDGSPAMVSDEQAAKQATEMESRSNNSDSNTALKLNVENIKVYEGAVPDFFEIDKGCYIVYGQFDKLKSAEKLFNKLSGMGITSEVRFSTVSSKHYVIEKKHFSSETEAESFVMANGAKDSGLTPSILVVR